MHETMSVKFTIHSTVCLNISERLVQCLCVLWTLIQSNYATVSYGSRQVDTLIYYQTDCRSQVFRLHSEKWFTNLPGIWIRIYIFFQAYVPSSMCLPNVLPFKKQSTGDAQHCHCDA